MISPRRVRCSNLFPTISMQSGVETIAQTTRIIVIRISIY